MTFLKKEKNLNVLYYPAPEIQNLDSELEKIRPSLLGNFVSKWSKHTHSDEKKNLNCSKLINIDGNFKCNRIKCVFSGIEIEFKEYKNIEIGCNKTPMRGSYFCQNHLNCEQRFAFSADDKKISYDVSQIKTLHVKKSEVKNVFDCFYDQSGKLIYLVQTQNDTLVWVDERSIYKEQLNNFISKKNKSDENQELSCNTDKSKGVCDFKSRTKGTVLSVYNCGIVTGYREIFGSESCSQILLFYLDIGEYMRIPYPKFLIYDDACHLKKVIDKNVIWEKSERAAFLKDIRLAIDRLHFGNHKDKWCRENLNPNNIKELDETNTVVCEETNFWLSGYKHILKHMNHQRFHFFLFLILNMYNGTKT